MFVLIRKIHSGFKNEVLSGLTVALALVPEAVAFSFVADVDPLVGLYAAFIVGLITSLIGGRPGMIAGATGALAIVMVSLVAQHGVEYLFATVVLMGIFQVLSGVLRLGKFFRLIPHPVMLGFVNGLAIVIFMAQLPRFEGIVGFKLGVMIGLIALTVGIIYFLPKLTKAFPASLAAILVISGIVYLFHLDTPSVINLASIKGGFPKFHIPMVPLNFTTLKIILPYSLILAAIGLIESLMTLQLIDELTETRGRSNKESIAQGVANFVTGFFGGMGGCAMIGQSMINIQSGGRTRLSSTVAALCLLSFIMFGSTIIGMIPIAALVGVMFMVSFGTFEWSSFRILRKIPKADAFIIVLVSITTVVFDLAIAVFAGVIVSALVFAWQKSKRIRFETSVDEEGAKTYVIRGPLFFGSAKSFLDIFNPKQDPAITILDFKESRVCDHSGLEVINSIVKKYRSNGKKILIKNLSPDCASSIKKAKILTDSQ